MFLSQEINKEIRAFLAFCVSTAISSTSLILWVILQWIVGELIGYFRLSGMDSWWLVAFQRLFAISTFVPIASHIVQSIILSIIQVYRTVSDELRQSGS